MSSFSINNKVIHQLLNCSELSNNWNGEGSKAPSDEVISFAHSLVDICSKAGQLIFRAIPEIDGKITLYVRKQGKSLELIIFPHQKIAVKIPVGGEKSQSDFDESDLPSLLEWLNGK